MTPRTKRKLVLLAVFAVAADVILFMLWLTGPYLLRALIAGFGIYAIFLVGVSEGIYHAEQQRNL